MIPALLLAITIQVTPTCKFTTEVADIPLEGDAKLACASELVQEVRVTGSKTDLRLDITYNIDMLGEAIAGTGKDIEAGKQSWKTWDYWRRTFGVTKFAIRYYDTKGRDLCWFAWDESKSSEVPTKVRCATVVGAK